MYVVVVVGLSVWICCSLVNWWGMVLFSCFWILSSIFCMLSDWLMWMCLGIDVKVGFMRFLMLVIGILCLFNILLNVIFFDEE